MNLSEVEKFAISVLREFDFLRKIDYEFNKISLYARNPFIVLKNNKLNIEIVFTFEGKFDLEILTTQRRTISNISLDEIISISGFKLAPFVPIESKVKWISDLLQNNFKDLLNGKKPIKDFKVIKSVLD